MLKATLFGLSRSPLLGVTDLACACEWVDHELHDRGWVRTYMLQVEIRSVFTRYAPLMHRVDEDQRIDGDPLEFRARGAKRLF